MLPKVNTILLIYYNNEKEVIILINMAAAITPIMEIVKVITFTFDALLFLGIILYITKGIKIIFKSIRKYIGGIKL